MATKEKENAVVPFDAPQTAVAVNMNKLQVKEVVTLPTHSIAGMREGDTFVIQAASEIFESDQIDPGTGELATDKNGRVKKIRTLKAYLLPNGGLGQLVLPAIPASALATMGNLRGRIFAFKKGKSKGLGKANLWDVVELHEQV